MVRWLVAVLAYKMSTWAGANVGYLCVTNYVDQQTLKPDDDYVLPHQRLWMFDIYSSVHCRRQSVSCYTAARLWNSLPSHVTAAPSLSIFRCRLKSHLFSLSLICTVPAQWLIILDTTARRHLFRWRRSVVVSALTSINVVSRHWVRLVLGWVTVCGRVNHLGM